ncbi:hypothetical protein GA830_16690 [Mesorhizobium sp. NBSH29]|uniref:hypothetical protein n=1 Tax=Mesorhizobium sp. NBSH29 TaxID=2654249 RepID=UPI0018966A9F|nr:hypothetical protein [Mesorhizobium sp. NBSH29]QPC88210.1 hypothetical protein GA830_16690 [Mesorhizobium sp. NBSH29]
MMTKLFFTLIFGAGLTILAGCQTTGMKSEFSPKYCKDRPFDAGICDQRTDFRLFDYVVGER